MFSSLPSTQVTLVTLMATSSQTGDVVLLLSCQLCRCDFRLLPVTVLILWKWQDLGDWRAWARLLARMPERAKEKLLHWLVQSFPPKQQSICQDWWHTGCFGFLKTTKWCIQHDINPWAHYMNFSVENNLFWRNQVTILPVVQASNRPQDPQMLMQ